ncbi:MAG: anthranilate synthase component I [Desulfomonilaceae bacterium]|nr:anthranilate synthase component I [Desulfomonilaceae bacterium]
MIAPSLVEFEELCRTNNLVPLFMEIPGDLDTPLSAFLKVDDGRNSFLLESVEGGERWARYSLLGSEPRMVVHWKGDRAEVSTNDASHIISGVSDPTALIKHMMSRYRPAAVPGLPKFFGGAVGFLSYDVVRRFERLPDLGKPDPGFHDAVFLLTRDMVIFDNLSHKIMLITTVSPDDFSSVKQAYEEGRVRLRSLEERMRLSPARPPSLCIPSEPVEFSSNMSAGQFEAMVREAKEFIRAGDVIQVVLSQRFNATLVADPLDVYRGLRMINPSPYMFFLRVGDEVLAGSSPEVMVRLRNGEAVVRPIAGTRARGTNQAQDEELERELLADEKESAEHVMLVDLARNDLGRIAEPGSVTVDAFKTVERYSHVMHMVSNVRAKPSDKHDAFDILRATFPAGTLTGAPKIRAMEIIERLEPEHRGPYGGCVGYFAYTGSMDMCITIRTVTMKGNQAFFQAGAGIVADSIPEREYEETMRKAEAMRKALALAGSFGRRSL